MFFVIHAVPATPTFDVCAVYDTLNRALQVIETTWMIVVCNVCLIKTDVDCTTSAADGGGRGQGATGAVCPGSPM